MTDWKAYGEAVKQLREARGWSQGKLGHLAGDISQSTIRDVESGEYKQGPHPDTVAGIQLALGHQPGEAGYQLTKQHVGRARADAIAGDGQDTLLRIIQSIPDDRRDEATAAIRDLLSDLLE